MGIQYFYNFCIKAIDDTDLGSDILSAVRRGYFATFEKTRDKITYDSEGVPLLYDYCIEKNKPMRWTVKDTSGALVQEVVPAEDGRYYLCFYREDKLFKRLLFSKLHTLLRAEYMDELGTVAKAIEPRKSPGGLCLLYADTQLPQSVVLYAQPEVNDERILCRLNEEFSDYYAVAATDEGIVWFVSDEQAEHFRTFVETVQAEIDSEAEVSFIGDEAPLFEKINVKDFNIKRNLSTSLDISQAQTFGEIADDPLSEYGEDAIETDFELQGSESDDESIEADIQATASDEENVETTVASDELAVVEAEDLTTESYEATTESEVTVLDDETADSETLNTVSEDKEIEITDSKPDKLIMADGAVYSYYGALDDNENRSGYGRTVTDIGRTAYEGMYLNDKRSGKGAYFYKDGTLCYSGDWSQNVRHGIGVGISASDGSMHIGRWVKNKPEGNGVRLGADGEIKFVCKELSDGGTVLMNYREDDTVLISKYDKDGSKLSEKIVPLTD